MTIKILLGQIHVFCHFVIVHLGSPGILVTFLVHLGTIELATVSDDR